MKEILRFFNGSSTSSKGNGNLKFGKSITPILEIGVVQPKS